MYQLRTIGVYGFDASSFLDSLNKGGVSMLLDVRQRRGVRGTQYAWANSQRLQASLAAADPGDLRFCRSNGLFRPERGESCSPHAQVGRAAKAVTHLCRVTRSGRTRPR